MNQVVHLNKPVTDKHKRGLLLTMQNILPT